jgi:hypothetical protein
MLAGNEEQPQVLAGRRRARPPTALNARKSVP